jgi:RNA polymerase sigma-70 factor (ECF subfamily)
LTLYCGDRRVAEELAQDALVRVWERWPEVAAHPAPEAWAFRTGLNLAHSWHRRRSAERRAHRRHGPLADVDDPADVATVTAIRDAVAALPERQRATVVARFFLGLDVRETAELLGCAEGTVKAHTHKALANLRASGLLT